ncbi:MAG TPA: DUF885 domain-containing protein [Candidatus Bathyarchaeia archaeon]|nr:DUF885 domain-containing protein [Candidatus Bathyarchaeia archaeon]
MNADEKFEKLTDEMIGKFLEKNPDFATQLGLHDPYDYQLPKGSTERFLENLRLEEEWVKRLKETVKYEELNDEHKLNWRVVEKFHENSKFYFDEMRMHELNPDAFDIIGGVIFLMLTRDYAPLEKRMDAIAARIEKIPKYLEEFRSRFEKTKPVKLWTEVAIESAQSMGSLFQFILHVAKGNVPPKVYERLNKAVENLQPALKVHIEWLNSLLPRTTEKWALGKEKFEKLVKLRELGMTSEEILQLGEKYLKELKTERKRLAQQIAPGKSEQEIMKKIASNAPKTFEEALKFTEQAMNEAKQFVQEKKLATVYPEDKLLVKETPEYLTPIIPFAAMMMPAKYDKPQIGVYIVTRPRDIANLGNHLNYHSVKNTAVHEAYPGHFLQGAVSNRGSIVRLVADGTETTEGWAHYCEEMMAEKGFITDKEAKLIQVNDVIWRAVRIIVDVKLSRDEMSFDEAVDMLVKETGMSREAAVAEVKRYTQTPGYPLSYLLGKHLILQLKKEVIQRMGSKFDERFFHDTITANGYLPISLLRKVFDQKLNKL